MAVTSDIIHGPGLIGFGEVRQATAALLDRIFIPRELILRASGQVTYLRLSSRAQKLAASIVSALLLWGLFATASYLAHSDVLAAKDRVIENQALAYRDLDGDFKRALADQARLEAEIAGLSRSLGREIEISGALARQRAALEREGHDLQQRLAALREAHKGLIERFREHAMVRADAIETLIAVTGLDTDRLVASVHASSLGRGGPLIPLRGAVADVESNAGLAVALSGLNAQWDRLFALQEVRRMLPLAAPLRQYWISSGYGERDDPFTGERSRHAGVDMVAPLGSRIRATAPGRIVFAGKKRRYGRTVEIDHGHGVMTRFAHLGKILVKDGQQVQRGQEIGILGSSGRSTGPHLHYEIRSGDQTLNPIKFLEAGARAFEG